MEDQKDDLLRIIRESSNKGRSIAKQANRIGKYGQYVSDFADASEKVISIVSSADVDLQPLINSWDNLNHQIDGISQQIRQINFNVASSSANMATSFMANFIDPNYFPRFTPPGRESEALKASIELGKVIDRLADKSNAIQLLKNFGLSTATSGKKSPIELLEAACDAFEKPLTQTSVASTSLIPMRECLNSTVALLLQKRPNQERAKSHKNKILSIGSQTAYSGIEDWVIESIADRWENLSDELSSSKQKDIQREEWRDILRRAILLLIEFLQTLDQTKMR